MIAMLRSTEVQANCSKRLELFSFSTGVSELTTVPTSLYVESLFYMCSHVFVTNLCELVVVIDVIQEMSPPIILNFKHHVLLLWQSHLPKVHSSPGHSELPLGCSLIYLISRSNKDSRVLGRLCVEVLK